MADGRTHDAVGLGLSGAIAGFGIAWWASSGSPQVFYSAAVTAWGVWMFGPDLDTPSDPFNRWGLLKGAWKPYQKFKHRSIWTHIPLLSTTIRVLYLAGWVGVLWMGLLLLAPTYADSTQLWLQKLLVILQLDGLAWLKVLMTGLTVGDFIHWAADGFPIGNKQRK